MNNIAIALILLTAMLGVFAVTITPNTVLAYHHHSHDHFHGGFGFYAPGYYGRGP